MAREFRHILNTVRGEAVVEGVRLPLDRNILSRRMRRRLAGNKYEAEEVQAALSAVKPGDVVLELGAGLGFLSSLLRKRTAARAIICVEANPDLIPYIQQVHRLNAVRDTQVIHGVALPSDQERLVSFYCRADFWGSSLDCEPAYVRMVSVKGIPLSRLISDHRPDVLIMDIEGGECQLLSVPALDGVRALVLELHPRVYGEDGMKTVRNHLTRLFFEPAKSFDDSSVQVYHSRA
ncbi:MAG: FkbM family methyltransferase [Hyphomicrobiaceae bacterium]